MTNDPGHQDIANPLSDERRHGDERVRTVRVAHERDAPEPIHCVLASLTAFDERSAWEGPCRPERRRISIVPADLAARDVDLAAEVPARVVCKPFHRVKVHVKA